MSGGLIHFCGTCGSTRVQRLHLAWCDMNGNRVEADYESEPETMGYFAPYWCLDCEDNPRHVDVVRTCDVHRDPCGDRGMAR